MKDVIEEREVLRLDLETFLREMYRLGEDFVADPEDWDAQGVALMVFRVKNGRGEIMRGAAIEDFEAWRKSRNALRRAMR